MFLTGWHESGVLDPIQYLVDQCNLAGFKDVNPFNLSAANLVIILDEAQSSYRDAALWLGLIKSQSGRNYGLRICLFASYGSPAQGPTEYPRHTTPVLFGPGQRVSLLSSPLRGAPEISLFYNGQEFDDAIHRVCSQLHSAFSFDTEACRYSFSITNGHPGAVHSLTMIIFMVCISSWFHELCCQKC